MYYSLFYFKIYNFILSAFTVYFPKTINGSVILVFVIFYRLPLSLKIFAIFHRLSHHLSRPQTKPFSIFPTVIEWIRKEFPNENDISKCLLHISKYLFRCEEVCRCEAELWEIWSVTSFPLFSLKFSFANSCYSLHNHFLISDNAFLTNLWTLCANKVIWQ